MRLFKDNLWLKLFSLLLAVMAFFVVRQNEERHEGKGTIKKILGIPEKSVKEREAEALAFQEAAEEAARKDEEREKNLREKAEREKALREKAERDRSRVTRRGGAKTTHKRSAGTFTGSKTQELPSPLPTPVPLPPPAPDDDTAEASVSNPDESPAPTPQSVPIDIPHSKGAIAHG